MSWQDSPQSVIGAPVEDQDGVPLGTVADVHRDPETGQLTWLAVTGVTGQPSTTLAPAAGAVYVGGRLRLAVPALAVTPQTPPTGDTTTAGPEVTGPHNGNEATPSVVPDRGMTRAEEQLHITTEVAPYRAAVLQIETVTEQVMVPVTITRQTARIDYTDLDPAVETSPAGQTLGPEPASGGAQVPGAGSGRAGQATAWVTLFADEPVVDVARVAVERVRLVTDWVTGTQEVHTELAHEEITVDNDTAHDSSTG